MPRRGDPERIYQAQRAGVFMRLVSEGRLDQFDAEHWISRWEREAEASRGQRDNRYWSDAWDWIAEQRKARGKPDPPKTDMDAEGDDGQVYGG